MPPSSTKICGAPRATVSAAIVAPNISTYHSAASLGFSLMMCTWSNVNAGLLIVCPLPPLLSPAYLPAGFGATAVLLSSLRPTKDTAMAKNGFRLIDAEMHVMEPVDLWQRYIDPES